MGLGKATIRQAARRALQSARGAALSAAVFAGACSQTPLDTAPVVDLSRAHGSEAAAAPATPAAGASAEAGDIYVVQKGDTLFHIAMAHHVGLRDLARWNGLDETKPLQIGQRLRVREPAVAAAGAPEVASAPAAAPAEEAAAPAQAHAIAMPSAQSASRSLQSVPAPEAAAPAAAPGAAAPPAGTEAGLAAGGWVWPVDGRVLTPFDPVKSKGIDIAVEEDAPVHAVADGQVSYTGNPAEYGNLVILTHPDGVRSVYAHAKTIVAKQGDMVSRGQVIATAGRTGAPSAALHFEVRLRGVPVNPLDYLPPH